MARHGMALEMGNRQTQTNTSTQYDFYSLWIGYERVLHTTTAKLKKPYSHFSAMSVLTSSHVNV